jgi:phage virion morphogenesis protein
MQPGQPVQCVGRYPANAILATLKAVLMGLESMSELLFEIDASELKKKMDEIAGRITSKTKLLKLAGTIVSESVRTNFAQAGRPEKWKPSRRGTDQAVPGKTAGTLRNTNRLMNSITSKVQGDEVLVGTNVVYAAVHHFGAAKGSFGEVLAQVKAHQRTSRAGKKYNVSGHGRKMKLPWGDIPARPFLLVQDEDILEIEALSARWIIEGKT